MKILKRIFLGALVIILVIQIPFIYRRYEIERLAAKIAQLDAGRIAREDPKFTEYKGIIHAHTSLGGHSTGGFDELISAANSNGLDFVIMTEHWSDAYDTSALTLNGVYGKTLFVGGNEIDTADGDRFLMIPGSADAAGLRNIPTTAVLEKLHAENRLALITYPEKFKSWDSNFDGDEVFSLHTNAKLMNRFTAAFDVLWSYPSYPELTLATYFRRPDADLRQFDEISERRGISLFAGTDAHSNIGAHLFGDDAGHKLINLKLDPYAVIFRLAREHVLLDRNAPLTRESLVETIKNGRFFTGFDSFGDTSGFSFTAGAAETLVQMGGTTNAPDITLQVRTPVTTRIILLKNGSKFAEVTASEMSARPDGPGAYRVEVYRDSLGPPFDAMPWILSNPIYVR